MSEVLVISPDAVPGSGSLAAGPGIRYWNIARSLARDYGHSVTLAVPEADLQEKSNDFAAVVGWTVENIAETVAGHDSVILPHVHSGLSTAYPEKVDPMIPTAVDLYDPVLIENIGLQPRDDDGARSFAGYLAGVVPILKRGDFFVCANERQRYYYIGVLNVLGRINPLTYSSRFLELVPFGVEAQPPAKSMEAMRGSLVARDDEVILWFSGIYPWFDAHTLIEAMPAVLKERPKAKLVVMGGVHPRGHAPDDEFKRTEKRARELGLVGNSVFFTDWRPYDERANWYLESDLAVTTHKPSLETELSHRTRVVDFLWGGLPVITTRGDAVGEMCRSRGCGSTVPPGEPGPLAEEIVRILGDKKMRAEMSAIATEIAATELTWKKVVRPLAEFCAAPEIAADRAGASAPVLMSAVDTVAGHLAALGGPPAPTKLSAKVRDVYGRHGLFGLAGRTFETIVRAVTKKG